MEFDTGRLEKLRYILENQQKNKFRKIYVCGLLRGTPSMGG
jgi:hypothetical protein